MGTQIEIAININLDHSPSPEYQRDTGNSVQHSELEYSGCKDAEMHRGMSLFMTC